MVLQWARDLHGLMDLPARVVRGVASWNDGNDWDVSAGSERASGVRSDERDVGYVYWQNRESRDCDGMENSWKLGNAERQTVGKPRLSATYPGSSPAVPLLRA